MGEGTQIEPAVYATHCSSALAAFAFVDQRLQMSINVTQLAPDRALPLSTRRLLRLKLENAPDGT